MESARRLGHGLVDSAQNRLELLQSELAEEIDRLGMLLAHQALVALSALLTVQSLALVVLAVVWDTRWRVAATMVLAVGAVGGTIAAHARYRSRRRRPKAVFATSIQELEKDRQALDKAL